MRTIESVITVLPDGSVQIPPQPGLLPGAHRAVLMVAEPISEPFSPSPLQLKLLDLPGWPAGSTHRCEDLYGDGGR